MLYAVKKDEFCNCLLVVFGTEESISDNTLRGGVDVDKFAALQDELQDTCELCEDYLITSQRFVDEAQIPEVKAIVEAHGFVENVALLDCGWG